MARLRYEPINVFLNSRLVGVLRREASGAISIRYDRIWLDWEFVMPVSLSLPLREQAYSGAPVIAVFDNLLPDKDALRRTIAARTRADGIDAYSLLAAIGHDCVGALQFLHQDVDPGAACPVDGDLISEDEIAKFIYSVPNTSLSILKARSEFIDGCSSEVKCI
jgi:serine/threonine-protein kinase HipA